VTDDAIDLDKARERQFASRSEAARYAAQIRWGHGGGQFANAESAHSPLLEVTEDINVAIMTGAPFKPFTFEGMPEHIQKGLTALGDGSMEIGGDDYHKLHRDLRAYFPQFFDMENLSPETVAALKKRGWQDDRKVTDSSLPPNSVRSVFGPTKKEFPPEGYDRDWKAVEWNRAQDGQRRQYATAMANAMMGRFTERAMGGATSKALTDTKLLASSPNKRIALTRSEKTAVSILTTGKITTQFETGTSGGHNGLRERAAHELASFGVHPLAEPSLRPIYANFHPLGLQHTEANKSAQYGTVQFVMKPTVASRSTFTVHDSLGMNRNASPVNGPIRTGQVRYKEHSGPDITSRSHLDAIAKGEQTVYAEAQIHGGIKLSDISHIAFSGSKPSAALIAAATKHGIPIVVLGSGKDGKGKYKIYEDPKGVAKDDAMHFEKGRPRQFGSRSEAGRYAAQVRWGNRGGDAKPAATVAHPTGLEPTFDVVEAMTTGRPYAPLLEENMPPEIQRLLTSIENKKMTMDDFNELSPQLISYYDSVLKKSTESQEVRDLLATQSHGHYKVADNVVYRSQVAQSMSFNMINKHAEVFETKENIGEERARKYTADRVSLPAKRIAVAATPEAALQILTSGKITNQFETSTSGGSLDSSMRAGHEAAAYGTHPFALPSARPVYANLHPIGIQSTNMNSSEQYGSVQFVMKHQMEGRSTFSVNDSLGLQRNPSPVNGPITKGQYSWSHNNESALDYPDGYMTRLKQGKRTIYTEAQIHGGVKLSDVAYIAVQIPPKAGVRLQRKAAELGIPIKTIRARKEKVTGGVDGQFLVELQDEGLMKSVVAQIWEAVDSLVVEKGRPRKFGTREEAARYAAHIRWGTTPSDGPKNERSKHMQELKAEAASIRQDLQALGVSIDSINDPFGDVEMVHPAKGIGWDDTKGQGVFIDARNGELIPSPAACDIHERVLALGGKIQDEVTRRHQANQPFKNADEANASYAKTMQEVVGEVRTGGIGGTIKANVSVNFGIPAMDKQESAELDTALKQLGKIMPSDWITSGNTAGVDIRSDHTIPNGSFMPPMAVKSGFVSSTSTVTKGLGTVSMPSSANLGKFGGESRLEVLGHEMTHFAEFHRPHIRILEVAFMAHRTTGFDSSKSRQKPLKERIPTGKRESRFAASTTTGQGVEIYTDSFRNLYSGRMYAAQSPNIDRSGNSFYELMSTGMEQFINGNKDFFDRDYMSFVLGTLTTA
jgi:hypothetical protein